MVGDRRPEAAGGEIEEGGDQEGDQAACYYTRDAFEGEPPLSLFFLMDGDDDKGYEGAPQRGGDLQREADRV